MATPNLAFRRDRHHLRNCRQILPGSGGRCLSLRRAAGFL
jgi:hypothetical protein